MDHIAADVDSQITTDGAWFRLEWFGGTDQLAGTGDHPIAFPHHGHHRSRRDEVHKTGEERPLLVDAVVLLSQFTTGDELLEAHKLETFALEAAENLAHETTLNPIRLDGDERAFGGHKGIHKENGIFCAPPPSWQAIENGLFLPL